MINNTEPTLEAIEDYNGNESEEKRKTIYGIISVNSSVSDEIKTQTNIIKY